MKSIYLFTAGLMLAGLAPSAAQAQLVSHFTPDAPSKATCEARGGSNNGHASYAEAREQTLAQAPLDTIHPSPNAAVRVHGWDNASVLVRACIHTTAPNDAEARALAGQVNIARGPGQIEPSGPERDHDHSWEVAYEVWVPRQSNLDVATTNGGIAIENVSGKIHFHGVNGGVHLARVNGEVDGSTVNGGVHVELAGARWEGAGLNVSTTNGGVSVELPQNYAAHLEASTTNGGVHSDFQSAAFETKGERRHKSVSVEIGGGGAPIHVSTVNGGVHFSKGA